MGADLRDFDMQLMSELAADLERGPENQLPLVHVTGLASTAADKPHVFVARLLVAKP